MAENEVPSPPATKKRSATERIRERLLGLQGARVKLKVDGEEYLLIAPSQKKRGQINSACLRYTPEFKDGKPTGKFDVNMDNTELRIRALAVCLRDNDTERPVFGDGEVDLEAIRELPVNGLWDQLMDSAVKLFNPDQVQVEKNSATAPGESSSMASP